MFRECLRFCGLERDIRVHTVADLPAFTGLGSSSSFTVALLNVLHAFKGEFVPPLPLAYEAIHVERHRVKDRVGCQTRLWQRWAASISSSSGVKMTLSSIVCLYSPRIDEFERYVFLVFTGITARPVILWHNSLGTSGTIARRSQACAAADQGWDILTGNRPLAEFGTLLHNAWLAKRSLDHSVSSSQIDSMYARGREAGALGGKLSGAGGGGFLLFFAPPETHPRLEAAFPDHTVLKVRINAPGSEVIFA